MALPPRQPVSIHLAKRPGTFDDKPSLRRLCSPQSPGRVQVGNHRDILMPSALLRRRCGRRRDAVRQRRRGSVSSRSDQGAERRLSAASPRAGCGQHEERRRRSTLTKREGMFAVSAVERLPVESAEAARSRLRRRHHRHRDLGGALSGSRRRTARSCSTSRRLQLNAVLVALVPAPPFRLQPRRPGIRSARTPARRSMGSRIALEAAADAQARVPGALRTCSCCQVFLVPRSGPRRRG